MGRINKLCTADLLRFSQLSQILVITAITAPCSDSIRPSVKRELLAEAVEFEDRGSVLKAPRPEALRVQVGVCNMIAFSLCMMYLVLSFISDARIVLDAPDGAHDKH